MTFLVWLTPILAALVLAMIPRGASAASAPTFAARRDEYASRWARMKILPQYRTQLERDARIIMRGKERYQSIEKQTGIPWFLVGLLHMREASCNFSCHLHNGDPLTARTRHVPAGRPVRGTAPFRWEDSALDALTMAPHSLHLVKEWTPERLAYESEKYNGWGYYYHGVPSAYDWSFSDQYKAGKYIADGKWSSTHKDEQPGVMPLLKVLMELDASVKFGATPAPTVPHTADPVVPTPAPAAPPVLTPKAPAPEAPAPAPVVPKKTVGVLGSLSVYLSALAQHLGAHPYYIAAGVAVVIIAAGIGFYLWSKKKNAQTT